MTALAAYQASLGLRLRRGAGDAEWARRRHRTLGPWLYALVLANWLAGLATVHWLRPELEESGTSGHYLLSNVICALFTAAVLLARRIDVDERARRLHPVVGAVTLLLCGVQVFLGLQLLP